MDINQENTKEIYYMNEDSEEEEDEYEKQRNKILSKLVTPGDVLGNVNDYLNGENTYIFKNEIRSSTSGIVKIIYAHKNTTDKDTEKSKEIGDGDSGNGNNMDVNINYVKQEKSRKNKNNKIIKNKKKEKDIEEEEEEEEEEIKKKKPIIFVKKVKNDICLPKIGDIVICKTLRISGSALYCEILVVNETPLKYPFRGIVNKGDISVDGEHCEHTFECFSQQDLIKAKVLAYGNNFCFKLTTVGQNLGVIISINEHGEVLEPVAWCFMFSHKEQKLIPKKVSIEALTFYEELMKVAKK